MNMQQVVQSKPSSNGFARRRGERDLGTRLQIVTGASVGGKVGIFEGPSRDRLVYMTTCLIGQPVEVQLKDGSIYSGIFHAGLVHPSTADREFGVILKMACLTKDGSSRWPRAELVNKPPTKTFIIPGKELVQVLAKDVTVSTDGFSNDLQHEKHQEILLDSYISHSRLVDVERELGRWVPDNDDPQCPELDDIFDGPWNRLLKGWDQFETNETLFGVKSTFDEELYTTKLERGPQMRELEKEALRIAREIEDEETHDLHLAEERGISFHDKFDIDEETRFSSVDRGRRDDDSGYEENEDRSLDSCNIETFGISSAPVVKRNTSLIHWKNSDEAQLLPSSSLLDEANSSQSNDGAKSCHTGSFDQSSQLASELTSRSFSISECENRIEDNPRSAHGAEDISKELIQEQMVQDAQWSKLVDSQSSLIRNKDGLDNGALSSTATAYSPPSHVSLTGRERISTPVELSEVAVSTKVPSEAQSNACGRPGSSASSSSGFVSAANASSGLGLSPSSSMGSLSSEKSTLNPHAKEFRLNPNAKSFMPSQISVRPASPVSDGSFYYPSGVSAVPHMPGMPMGVGIGPSFSGHQPVFFDPQAASMQTPQAYFPPTGHQFGQQMLLGHPRQVLYMPSYQPYTALIIDHGPALYQVDGHEPSFLPLVHKEGSVLYDNSS
ncbi:polyadenylate-binding protein-interacting protein 3-like isoform X3 [Tripterygium wilfordii]|uniref:polyadenylate-binding protein-interacting protein 3-like isoform X3 n=1 Tax=Tripterygium wilfordii TaxID=458696 RepID=UPI0018F848F3|nr:polyadenylate-binding protein-interacting protein 3-like isoform X3 [Tripterygium wilfordii]